jgi:hypothetical protein
MTAFLLTWKAIHWPHPRVARMAEIFSRKGYVIEPWKIFAHRQAKSGDRVWLLQQGAGPKVIFGAGHLMEGPTLRSFDGNAAHGAPIKFDAFVDPLKGFLIGETELSGILKTHQLAAQASGHSALDEHQEIALGQHLAAQL